jgi:Kef-type K+ transport system membrane component KefB
VGEYKYILDLAIILAATKALGLLSRKINLPQVVGALVAGLLLGPAVLGFVQPTDFLSHVSEVGVIVIMFSAGMGTSLKELKESGKSGFIVALLGVLVPIILGTGIGFAFNTSTAEGGVSHIYQNIFIGVIFTATSVSITVETLREMGKLSTPVGNTILAAAIIDDVLGLICLTVVTGLGGGDVSIGLVLLKIVGFLAFAVVGGIGVCKFMNWYMARLHDANLQRFPVMAFIFCLIFAFVAEYIFGVADITGAFAAGLAVGATREARFIESRFQPLSFLLLTPVFFANIGLSVTIPDLNAQLLLITVSFVVLAILSKLVGCGLGAKICGMTSREALQTGVGMVCRGEVALIVAKKGESLGLMNDAFMGPVIITVVACAILTPVMLKGVFHKDTPAMAHSDLAERMATGQQLDAVTRQVLQADAELRQPKSSGKSDQAAK